MTTLRRLFHWCLDISKVFVFVALLLLAPLALVFWPLLLLWLVYEAIKAMRGIGEQESEEMVSLGDTWNKATTDIWTIGQQYEPRVMLNSMQIARLLQFAERWQWTEQDTCLGHVEEEQA